MSFYGLEIAKTALFASSKALEVTGNNVANANTVGYTRQRLVLESTSTAIMGSRFSNISKATNGGGVTVAGIEQMRDTFLDSEYRRENADASRWSTRTDTMEYVESLFNETSDTGISSTLADFFDSLSELSKDPVSKEVRTNVQQSALKVTETLNSYYNQLAELQNTQNESMKTTVDQINELVTSLAQYNKQIYTYELSGEKANDLRDKRNSMLDTLSGLINIDYSEDSNGYVNVTVGGQTLVSGITATTLDAVANQTGVVTGQTGFYSIYLHGTTTALNYSSGQLQAYKDMRDGNSADTIGIPRIIDNLNTLARSLAKEFNAVNSTGYTLPYDTTLSRTGVNFFDVPSGNYNNVTAGNFTLSADVLANVNNIAASDTLVDLSASSDQRSNNKNALKMVALTSSVDVDTVSNFENYLKSAIVEIAIDSAHCQKMNDSQQSVLANLVNRKESISGVSTDEEMINMVKYQHAYTAASRVITVIDEMLDTLINRTGAAGR